MTTVAQWVEGARPRTLPAAVAPVAVGTGVAASADAAHLSRAALALLVALALQVGVNYANDYSDGIRGTDTARVGPFRLVGSGAAAPAAVRTAAFVALGVAALTGLVLVVMSSWWLLIVGVLCLGAAWTYTGGARPYGYRGLGEVSVFVFFGLVAVVGTAFVQSGQITVLAILAAIPVGMLACALLVVNNLRDIPTDTASGKRTLAVALGASRTRIMAAGLLVAPFASPAVLAWRRPWTLLVLLAVPLVLAPLRRVLGGATGRELIPALRDTGRVQLGYGLLLAISLGLS